MIRKFVLLLMAMFTFSATGCYVVPPSVKGTGVATDQYKVELELVPDAKMVTEDISPVWDLGRHAFERGTDRLLVISRTTSYSEKDDDYKVIPGTLRERRRERAWITIPGDIPLGKAIKLEELEREFFTGFDVNNLDGKGPLNSTALMKGYVVLTGLTETEATLKLHIEIRPNRPFLGKDWEMQGEETVKIYRNGHYATHSVSRDSALVVGDPEGGKAPAKPDPNTLGAANDNDTTNNATQASNGSNTDVATNVTNPSNPNTDTNIVPDNVKTTVVAAPKELSAENVHGRWAVSTKAFDWRFQFEKNGVFIFSTTRGNGVSDGYDPGVRYGYYTLKKSRSATWIVLDIKQFRFGNSGRDSMPDLKENPILVKAEMDGQQLILSAKFLAEDKTYRLALDRATYQDMNQVLPPKGRQRIPGEKNTKPFKPIIQTTDSN